MNIMKDNTQPDHNSLPFNKQPLNGNHNSFPSPPSEELHGLPGSESAPLNFDDFRDSYYEDADQVFRSEDFLTGEELHDGAAYPAGSFPDGAPPIDTARNAGDTSASPSAEWLPSAGYITPGKIAYYSRLAQAPRLDLDFIKAEARAGNADGESRVAAHHGQLYGMARAGLQHTLIEKHTSVIQNLRHLADDIERTRTLLGATRQFEDVPGAEPALHWTWPDRLAALIWGGFAAIGVAMDFFTWATILRQSDEHFYHNPGLAFFFGAVPLALPVSIKVLLGGLTNDDGSDRGLRRTAWLGVAVCLATIAFFTLGHDGIGDAHAATFGALGGQESATLGIDWKTAAQKMSSMMLMAAAAVFSALSCHFLIGMFKRRRAGRVFNPQYAVTARQLARLQGISHDERETLGALKGKMRELDDEKNALVGSAVNYYRELRTALTQAEQRLSKLLEGPGGSAKTAFAQKLKKGARTLGLALAVAATLILGGCGGENAAGSARAASGHTASRTVLGLSPEMNSAERAEVWNGACKLALTCMPAGGTLEAWDALNLHRICVFTIPSDPFYEGNAAARQKIASPAMAELRLWLNQPLTAGDPSPRIIEPQFLETVTHAAARPGESTAILLAGSAIYSHPRDGSWALTDDEFHNDGHFDAPQEVTPFSVRGREQALKNVVIYHSYLRDEFHSEAQREGEQRFLSLFIKRQQGALAAFTRDIAVALDKLIGGASDPILDPVARPEDDKPGMRTISILPAATALRAAAPLAPQRETRALDRIIGEISESEKRSILPPASSVAPKLQVGFKWSVKGLDVDGYCAHHPGSRELCYSCLKSPEGRFWKDWQTAPTGVLGVNGFEIISFDQPTDLAQATCWLNLYRGHAPGGVDVTVQVVLDEQRRYNRVVHISAQDGNRGANPQTARTIRIGSVSIFCKSLGLPNRQHTANKASA